MNGFRIVMAQTDISWCDPETNRKRIENLFFQSDPCDLFVLPEMFSSGFCMEPWLPGVADSAQETLEWMQKLAKFRNCALTGSLSVCEQGNYYNRLYFVTPTSMFVYDKRHLFSYGGEDKVYQPGKERVIVSYRGVRILLQICYDLRFPVFCRNHGDYDIILYVANWPVSRIGAWDILLRARALENQCYVVAVNRVGKDPVSEYVGHSQIVDAFGQIVVKGEEGKECCSFAMLDLDRLRHFRSKFPVLSDADSFTLL